jgi:hypothetical protein
MPRDPMPMGGLRGKTLEDTRTPRCAARIVTLAGQIKPCPNAGRHTAGDRPVCAGHRNVYQAKRGAPATWGWA